MTYRLPPSNFAAVNFSTQISNIDYRILLGVGGGVIGLCCLYAIFRRCRQTPTDHRPTINDREVTNDVESGNEGQRIFLGAFGGGKLRSPEKEKLHTPVLALKPPLCVRELQASDFMTPQSNVQDSSQSGMLSVDTGTNNNPEQFPMQTPRAFSPVPLNGVAFVDTPSPHSLSKFSNIESEKKENEKFSEAQVKEKFPLAYRIYEKLESSKWKEPSTIKKQIEPDWNAIYKANQAIIGAMKKYEIDPNEIYEIPPFLFHKGSEGRLLKDDLIGLLTGNDPSVNKIKLQDVFFGICNLIQANELRSFLIEVSSGVIGKIKYGQKQAFLEKITPVNEGEISLLDVVLYIAYKEEIVPISELALSKYLSNEMVFNE